MVGSFGAYLLGEITLKILIFEKYFSHKCCSLYCILTNPKLRCRLIEKFFSINHYRNLGLVRMQYNEQHLREKYFSKINIFKVISPSAL